VEGGNMSNGMIVTDTQKTYEIDCDRDLEVPDDGKEYHVVDLIYFAGLQQPHKYADGKVTVGKKYNIKLLAVVIELPEEINDVKEDKPDAVSESKS
jgi:hypothetical protein